MASSALNGSCGQRGSLPTSMSCACRKFRSTTRDLQAIPATTSLPCWLRCCPDLRSGCFFSAALGASLAVSVAAVAEPAGLRRLRPPRDPRRRLGRVDVGCAPASAGGWLTAGGAGGGAVSLGAFSWRSLRRNSFSKRNLLVWRARRRHPKGCARAACVVGTGHRNLRLRLAARGVAAPLCYRPVPVVAGPLIAQRDTGPGSLNSVRLGSTPRELTARRLPSGFGRGSGHRASGISLLLWRAPSEPGEPRGENPPSSTRRPYSRPAPRRRGIAWPA